MTSTQSEARAAILDRFADIHGSAVRSLAADDQALADMPAEILRFEVPDAGRYYFVHIAEALREGRALTDAELDRVRTRAQVRAEEEFPLPLIMHNWMRGAGILASALIDVTRPGEEGALAELLRDLLGPVEQLLTAVAETYIQQRDALAKHERGAEQMVARALLAGQDAAGLAEQAGIALAVEYDVVAMAFSAPAAADEDSIAVARRRRTLRIMSAIDRSGRRDVLAVFDGDAGFLLVPRREGGAGGASGGVGAVIESVQKAAGGVMSSAVAAAPVDRIPDAADEAERVRAIATANGLGPGPHELGVVALDYQLAAPGIARDRLVAVLDPLRATPELIATVETLLACDGDRNRAARTLGVHPNTIANRIARITDLLGFDPLSTHGIVTLSAGFAARRAATLDG